MAIEISQGQKADLQIYDDSDPDFLAQEFVSTNRLPSIYIKPLK